MKYNLKIILIKLKKSTKNCSLLQVKCVNIKYINLLWRLKSNDDEKI